MIKQSFAYNIHYRYKKLNQLRKTVVILIFHLTGD